MSAGVPSTTKGVSALPVLDVPRVDADPLGDLNAEVAEERIAAQLERDHARAHRGPVCRCIPGPLAQWDDRLEERTCARCGRTVEVAP